MTRPMTIEQRLTGLVSSSETELLDQFQRLFGVVAPIGLSHELLQAAVGYRLQKVLIGRLQHRMMQVIEAAEAIVSALSVSSDQTVLIREWRGHCHVVTVIDGDVWYQGESYRSLSAVAQAISGKPISGESFFTHSASRVRGR